MPREIRVVAESGKLASMPIIDSDGTAQALVWPGMGAHLRSMHRVSLSHGGRTVALRHPMEAVYYVIDGEVAVDDIEAGTGQRVGPGGMFLIDPGTSYRISAVKDGTEIVGGPCPADPELYRHLDGE